MRWKRGALVRDSADLLRKDQRACTDKNQLHATASFSPVFIPEETLQVLVVPGC